MMKKICYCLIAASAIQLFLINVSTAQTISLKTAPAKVIIDGSLTEWGDSLTYYNSDTQLNYTLANDKDNLYLVLKTKDLMEQSLILSSGVTLSIDTKGRKKASYSVTFPVQEEEGLNLVNEQTLQQKKSEASITKIRKIKADGFKDVEYDLFTLENTYGFRAAINYDEHGFLVYEEVIPLALFHADDLKKNEWAFDIRVNAPQKLKKDDDDNKLKAGLSSADNPDGSSNRSEDVGPRGRGSGRKGGGRQGAAAFTNDNSSYQEKSVDFWGKFTLSKAQ